MASISTPKNIEGLVEALKAVFTGFLQEQAQATKGKIKIDDVIQAFQADEVQTKLIDAIQANIPKATRKSSKDSKPKDPNAPKRPKSSYLFFCEDKRDEVKEDYPDLKATEITSKLGELWKALPDSDKTKYIEQAEEAKESYKEKMSSYVRPSDEELLQLAASKKGKKGKKGEKRPKDPNAPKRPKSSYLFFCEDKRDLVKEAEPDLKATEVTSKLGQLWKALSDKQKQKYVKKAEQAKEHYNDEMKSYVRPSDEELAKLEESKPKRKGSKGSKGKRKESGAPKRPMTAFLLFSMEKREEVKADNPELKGTDISKELGRMWKDDFADKESRAKWVDQAEKEKERYKKEMEAFNESKKDAESDADEEEKPKTKAKAVKAKSSKANSKTNSKTNSKPVKKAEESSDSEDSESELDDE
jgi:hypothetical protein